MLLGDTFPDFIADSTIGPLSFYDYVGESWAILFSHPADFTPVCTTELGTVAKMAPQFEQRGVKLLALSCESVENHKSWITDIMESQGVRNTQLGEEIQTGNGWPFPIIADKERDLAVRFGMLDPDELNKEGLPLSARVVFVIGKDKKLKLSILYPATTGRNFDEILRVVDSLQLTAQYQVATPANWKHGDKCMIQPDVSAEDAKIKFPNHEMIPVPSGKQYLRLTPQPNL